MSKTINSLWRPPADMPKPRKIVKRAPFIEEEKPFPPPDETCTGMKCRYVGRCDLPCAWASHINGKSPLKEWPIHDEMESVNYQDYNAVLAERITATREIEGEIISGIIDLRKRAIVLLLDAGFLMPDVARFFRCSERTIYRIREKK